MKKSLSVLFLFCVLLATYAQAQQRIKIAGKVTDAKTNEPLPYVSVYINNTTTGTVTDEKGNFRLELVPGNYQLVVSFTGYEPIIYNLVLTSAPPPFHFKLSPKARELQEVSINARRDKNWYANFKLFRELFLGTSPVAVRCKIVNPEVLQITFVPETNILTVKARDFILIDNPELGYKLKYLLVEFKLNKKEGYVSYLGYPNFEPLTGSEAQEKRWERNRQKAYQGSIMHFVRTLRNQRLEQEGYYLRRINPIPNLDRPTPPEITAAQNLLRARPTSATLIREAAAVLERAKAPAYKYEIDTTRVPYPEYLSMQNDLVKMAFPGYFQVMYTREKEDFAYTGYRSNYQSNTPAYQHSVLRMLGKSVTLEQNGNIQSPLDILFEGYWAWEKTGDLLPLDYKADEINLSVPKDAAIMAITLPLEKYTQTHPQEKIYVHVDKPFYVAGETIWFKTYLLNAASHTSDTISGNIYTELISPAGKIIQRHILKVKESAASGDFSLPDSLAAGTYILRAYTNWMRNFSPDFFFNQSLPIYNSKAGNNIAETNLGKNISNPANQATLSASTVPSVSPAILPNLAVQFFPEGGYLVAGIESKIGLKAVTKTGESIAVSGTVVDDKGLKVVSFATTHAGMGSFLFKPVAGKIYRARINTTSGDTLTTNLPAVQEKGYVLQTDNSDENYIQVTVSQNIAVSKEVILVAQVRGSVKYAARIKVPAQVKSVLVPKVNMPSGIAQLTLFDAPTQEPLAERLVFIDKEDNLLIQVKSNKEKYLPREKVQLDITVTNPEGTPIETDLSLAVTDGKISGESFSQNLNSYLLLNSDLKGTVEQPGYYFKDRQPETQVALDNLLLTQGWRRFSWPEIAAGQLAPLAYNSEKDLSVSGQVKQLVNNKAVPNGNVILSLLKPALKVFPGKTDENGMFTFSGLSFENDSDALIQAETGKGNQRVAISLTPVKAAAPLVINPLLPADSAFPLRYAINRAIEQNRVLAGYKAAQGERVLKEVSVTGKKGPDASRPYGQADKIIKVDKNMQTFSNILDGLRGRLGAGFVFLVPDALSGDIVIRNRITNQMPTFLIDGISIDTATGILNSIPPADIETVEIIRPGGNAAIYGKNAFENGVIAIFLKKGPRTAQAREGSISTKLPGYYKAREFYAPTYDIPKEEHSLPDKRTTLYWNPTIKTDATGKASVTFYNTDEVTGLHAVLEGISPVGLAGSHHGVIGNK